MKLQNLKNQKSQTGSKENDENGKGGNLELESKIKVSFTTQSLKTPTQTKPKVKIIEMKAEEP